MQALEGSMQALEGSMQVLEGSMQALESQESHTPHHPSWCTRFNLYYTSNTFHHFKELVLNLQTIHKTALGLPLKKNALRA